MDTAYEAEVQHATASAEMRYQKARQRLLRAMARRARAAERVERNRNSKRAEAELRRAEREVVERQQELADIHRMMRGSPSSSVHRGRAGTPPPVPEPGELI